MLVRVAAAAVAVAVVAASAAADVPPPVTGEDFSDVYSFSPAWSPDGTRLALVRSVRLRAHSDVIVMNLDRSGARRIGAGYGPAWSPDGRWIAFLEAAEDPHRYLTVAEADGSRSRRLLRILPYDVENRPSWSPDGRLIAFGSGGKIFVVRPDGRGLRTLVSHASSPAWSPDGRRIVFVGHRPGECCHLEVANADGSGRARLRAFETLGVTAPKWSPDGRLVAVAAGNSDTGSAIYVLNPDGSGAKRITPYGFRSPTWAPDSRRLAVASEGRPLEIYTIGLDGAAPVRMTYGGCTIVGTDGADTLAGRAGDDVVCAFGGDDAIDGGSGDDRILGGSGDDRIVGGTGHDAIFGEDGADLLDGGPGRDSIHGGSGGDAVGARDGEIDFVTGGVGEDRAVLDPRDCVLEVERRDGAPPCEPHRSFAVTHSPEWSPDGRRIAFVNQVGRVGTIYVTDANGRGRPRRVTDIGFDAQSPSWSPDGRRIVFHHSTSSSWSRGEIYVADVGGSRRRIIARGHQPAWGPRGRKIAFTTGQRLWVVAPDGRALRMIANSRDECELYIEPTWSPDGEYVAFAATGAGGECGFSIFIGATRGYGRVKVLAGGWFEQPHWSPDGKRLAVATYPPGRCAPKRGYYGVAIFELRTGHLRCLGPGWRPRWSPDGRRIAFVRGDVFAPAYRAKVYVMNADGSNLRQLTP